MAALLVGGRKFGWLKILLNVLPTLPLAIGMPRAIAVKSHLIPTRSQMNIYLDDRSMRMNESNAWTHRQFTSTIRNNERV
jgi:hypothetical protein